MIAPKLVAVVYLSAPYSSDPENNVREACRTWDLLNAMYPEVLFICPHWSHLQHTHAPLTHTHWLTFDLKMLAALKATGLPIAMGRTPGHSEGCNIEEEWARSHDVPVFTGDPSSSGLLDWLDDNT